MSEEERQLDEELEVVRGGGKPPENTPRDEVLETELELEAEARARAEDAGHIVETPIAVGAETVAGPLAEEAPPPPPEEPKAEKAAEVGREQPPAENRIGELERRLLRADDERRADRELLREQNTLLQEVLRERGAEQRPAGPPTVAGVQLPKVTLPEGEITDYDGQHRSTAAVVEQLGRAVVALHGQVEQDKRDRQEQDRLDRRDDTNRRYQQGFVKLQKHVPAEKEEDFWRIVVENGIPPERLENALLIMNRERLLPVVTGAQSEARKLPPAATLVTEGGSAQRGAGGFRPLSIADFDKLSEPEQNAYERRLRAFHRERATELKTRVDERLQQ